MCLGNFYFFGLKNNSFKKVKFQNKEIHNMEELKKMLYERIPFYSTLGLELQEIGDGRASFALLLRNELMQNGNVHGGVLATILDETMSWAVIAATQKLMLTRGMDVRYLKPVMIGTKITAIGFIKKWVSKREVEVIAEITDEAGKLCGSKPKY